MQSNLSGVSLIESVSSIPVASEASPLVRDLREKIEIFRFVYRSQGRRVVGYVAVPQSDSPLPCIILNRGGSGERFSWTPDTLHRLFLDVASWGYIVITTQYSGNEGGEGRDEFGGQDLDDVLGLYDILQEFELADHKRIGMYGGSRGGMMTYMALARVPWIKAAVVVAGLANLHRYYELRPEQREPHQRHYASLDPAELTHRSAVDWPERFPKHTPLLLMHGTGDTYISPLDSLELAGKLYEEGAPYKLVIFPSGDHFLAGSDKSERNALTRAWLEKYI